VKQHARCSCETTGLPAAHPGWRLLVEAAVLVGWFLILVYGIPLLAAWMA
jgi:hypothetical protein